MTSEIEKEVFEFAEFIKEQLAHAEEYTRLLGEGYFTVVLPFYTRVDTGAEIRMWISDNVKRGYFRRNGQVWLFEDESEAMMFKMRWA